MKGLQEGISSASDSVNKMNKYDFSPDLFFRELYESRAFPFENKNADEIKIISADIKKRAEEIFAVGKIPGREETLSFEVISEEKRKSYEIKTLCVRLCKNLDMLCYLLTPEKPHGVGVVAVPGHGYGVRQIIRQSKNGKYRKINFLDNYQKNFAEELALRGNTVIAFEPVAFGCARLKKDMKKPFYISSCEAVSMHSLMYGFTTASLRIFQAQKCIDVLSSLGIDSFGIMGISGGGLVALYTSLLDERIDKTVVSGYVNTFGNSVLARWHCTDNYVPGLINVGDMYDFAACLAPKRLLIECGERDKLFPIEGSLEAIKRISEVYERLGVKENFVVDIHKGKHQVSGVKAFDFFKKG